MSRRTGFHSEGSADTENENEEKEGRKAIRWRRIFFVGHGEDDDHENSGGEELGEEAGDVGEIAQLVISSESLSKTIWRTEAYCVCGKEAGGL